MTYFRLVYWTRPLVFNLPAELLIEVTGRIRVTFTVDTAEGATIQPPTSRLSWLSLELTSCGVCSLSLERLSMVPNTTGCPLQQHRSAGSRHWRWGSEFTQLWDVNRKLSVSGFTVWQELSGWRSADWVLHRGEQGSGWLVCLHMSTQFPVILTTGNF